MKWTELTEQERNEIADRCLDNIVADYGNTVLKSSARNEYMIERTRRILRRRYGHFRNSWNRENFSQKALR